jgi:hypothetical protein
MAEVSVSMKIALFVGELNAQGLELLAHIGEQGYSCIKTSSQDEIDQVGQQCSRAILIFNDPKFAFKFLLDHKWSGFSLLNVLYLPQQPKMTPEVEEKLKKVSLTIYTPATRNVLLAKMKDFQSITQDDESLIEELEFSINEELGKEK